MPTPESAAFLAKKPTVPPTFDGVDYDDTKRLKQAQDAIIREQWVMVMMGRLVREELSKCYYREGVNHLEKCGHLRGQSSCTPSSKALQRCDSRDVVLREGISSTRKLKRTQCKDGEILTSWDSQSDTSSSSRTTGSRATFSSNKIISPSRTTSKHSTGRWAIVGLGWMAIAIERLVLLGR
ncbi:hypothetical protein B0H66DRAFT_542910 [Apodospora peruviana]|uniref:NADH-ubiquinone oxidoreductase 12 kDa subunit n=1 Tax=Apodospora peruviana TaxID=516989 RepID=A0AAE0IS47_9PEZI|nr:hypothetical protein B0H66DRAFT_542910 [Apodospora peruviana]